MSRPEKPETRTEEFFVKDAKWFSGYAVKVTFIHYSGWTEVRVEHLDDATRLPRIALDFLRYVVELGEARRRLGS